jgi:hypothetical protein
MSKSTLKITITVHIDGTISVLVEWISTNLSRGLNLDSLIPCWG